MRTPYKLAAFVVVVLGIILVAWMFVPGLLAKTQPSVAITDPAQTSKIAVAFVAPPYEDDFQNLRVSGYVSNLTGQRLASVDVEIQLLGEDGSRKKVAKYTVPDVPPGQRKPYDFTVGTFTGARTATIRVVSVKVAR